MRVFVKGLVYLQVSPKKLEMPGRCLEDLKCLERLQATISFNRPVPSLPQHANFNLSLHLSGSKASFLTINRPARCLGKDAWRVFPRFASIHFEAALEIEAVLFRIA